MFEVIPFPDRRRERAWHQLVDIVAALGIDPDAYDPEDLPDVALDRIGDIVAALDQP